MNISDKKTALDDSASIYMRREEKSDKVKWKELKGFRAKWNHFRDYYMLKTVIWVCVIAFVGYMLYETFGPEKERLLYVAVLDQVVLSSEVTELEDGYAEYVDMDEETQEIYFNTALNLSNDTDGTSSQVFTVHAMVGDIDIVIASQSMLQSLAGNYLRPLSDQLPSDLYEKVSDRFCYASEVADDGTVGEEVPYGILLTGLIEGNPLDREPVALAICGNSTHTKNAEEFVRYLLERSEVSAE